MLFRSETLEKMNEYTRIIFYKTFDEPVDNLPAHITHIEFGDDFNHPVNNLPPSVTYIEFGICFNQSIDTLPINLEYLSLGALFNHSIENLPPNLKTLILRHYGSIKLSEDIDLHPNLDTIPDSIENLIIHYYECKLTKLPSKLKILDFKAVKYRFQIATLNNTYLEKLITNQFGIDNQITFIHD